MNNSAHLRKDTTRGGKQNTKKILEILSPFQLASSSSFRQVGCEVLLQGLPTKASKLDLVHGGTKRLHEYRRYWNTEGRNKKQNQKAVARSSKNRASCQTNGCTEDENHSSPEILPPETFGEEICQGASIDTEILRKTVYETDGIHTGVEDVSKIEHDSN